MGTASTATGLGAIAIGAYAAYLIFGFSIVGDAYGTMARCQDDALKAIKAAGPYGGTFKVPPSCDQAGAYGRNVRTFLGG